MKLKSKEKFFSWTLPCSSNSSRHGAYYSVSASPGLRVISLNMNYCMNKNLWLLLDSNDPADELLWLIFELQLAELKGEKVDHRDFIFPFDRLLGRLFYTFVATVASSSIQIFTHDSIYCLEHLQNTFCVIFSAINFRSYPGSHLGSHPSRPCRLCAGLELQFQCHHLPLLKHSHWPILWSHSHWWVSTFLLGEEPGDDGFVKTILGVLTIGF